MASYDDNDSLLPEFSFCADKSDARLPAKASSSSSGQAPASSLTEAIRQLKGGSDRINDYKNFCENKRQITVSDRELARCLLGPIMRVLSRKSCSTTEASSR